MIAPGPKDIVIKKQKPSGFFGTNLASYLTLLGCDSVIVVGTTTSGCVRATVVDAFSLNYRVILAEEGCFDRSEASHAVSLCDMHAKYADVVPTAEVLEFIDTLPSGQYDLPAEIPCRRPARSTRASERRRIVSSRTRQWRDPGPTYPRSIENNVVAGIRGSISLRYGRMTGAGLALAGP